MRRSELTVRVAVSAQSLRRDEDPRVAAAEGVLVPQAERELPAAAERHAEA